VALSWGEARQSLFRFHYEVPRESRPARHSSSPRSFRDIHIHPFRAFRKSSHCFQTQRELKHDILYEIANHTWRFPPSEVARILLPKTPKHCLEVAGKFLLLDQHDCTVDELALQDALSDVVTQLEDDGILTSRPFSVHNLTSFLARCVEACHDALDKQQDPPLCQDRWYNNLQSTIGSALLNKCADAATLVQAG